MALSSPRQIDFIPNTPNGQNETLIRKSQDFFEYKYENALTKGNYQQRYQTKNRKITSDRIDPQLPDNSIHTAKYTLLNFVPKQLFEQFSKLANLYFLIIGFMQIIPQVSISNSVPVIFMPLSFIITVSALKDLYEDYKRRSSDQEENNRKIQVLKAGRFQVIPQKELRVGNIIKVEQDQIIPADVLLLYSSEQRGICYIETKSLDGETNLKQKNVSTDLIKIFSKEDCFFIASQQIILKYEAPNPYLNRFYGEIIDKNGQNSSINFNNFLLRGCVLKNIRNIYGLVAYTGHDTKIMLNSFKARSKKSKLELLMQKQILYIFIIQVTICCLCAIYYVIWYEQNQNNLAYLNIDHNEIADHSAVYNFFVRFGNWILIFTNFVPISLLVTLEMVKLIQGFFIIYDNQMNQPQVQSSNLNEELGQIEHIFTDKTGTLTCNIMEFKQIMIGNQNYGDIQSGMDYFAEDISKFKKVSNVDFRDLRLFDQLSDESKEHHQQTKDCLFMIATCHTIITDKNNDGETIYNASSPDELALVNFAKFCGVEYLGQDENNIMSIQFNDKIYKFQMLEVFEFTSARKRQSCLIKDLETNDIWLLTKGADTVLMDSLRLSSKSECNSLERRELLTAKLQSYGEVGLRTLVLARKKIQQSEFKSWSAKYQRAATSLDAREEKMQLLQDELEKGLDLIGATAIEDKLQPNVGKTIQAFKQAGINVWVLTGDKIETAINIGYSCKLLDNETKQHIVDENDEGMIKQRLDEVIKDLTGTESETLACENALIISGDALFHALKPQISPKVNQIGDMCTVVICCRVSPKQKQDVVSLIRKEKPSASTLAIGDGANDVNMITAAHVGVGIRGVEGQQAARASDYSVSEFQELRRILFYHGRESYRRNSMLVCYNFFKNVLLVLPQFWYGTVSTFSAQSLYDSFLYQLFNIFYASMPIIIFAVFDEEYKPEILISNQFNFYAQGLESLLFNTKVFWLWVMNGVWQASVICYFSTFINGDNFVKHEGFTSHVWANGTMVFGLVVVVSNLKIMIMSNTFTIISFIGILGSLLSYLISWIIIDSIQQAEAYMVLNQLWTTPNFHLGNLLTIVAVTFSDIAFQFYIRWSSNKSEFPKGKESSKLDVEISIKRSSIGLQTSQASKKKKAKGQLQMKVSTHTGFAFCSLERHCDPGKQDHLF